MTPNLDRDLASIQQARQLLRAAAEAAKAWAQSSQEDVDRACEAMARSASQESERLARLARDETGMGRYQDKILKNRFGSEDVWRAYKPLRTRGILREYAEARVKELAVPMGVVAAITPSTNPTSTAMYKALISVKAGNSIVFSPHPRATECVVETVRVLMDAAERAGAPPNLISSMSTVTLEGTNELMRNELTDVILATGGTPLVRAAYSAGKPAFGVGPGNVPAVIERTADVDKAVADIVAGKAFDNGLLCSAENSIVCDAPVAQRALELLPRYGAYICTEEEKKRLEQVLAPRGRLNTALAGQDASEIAARAGIQVPPETRVLVARLTEVGREEEPLSIEKLSPVLGFYVDDGWRACCQRAIRILKLGGLGHSLVIHTMDEDVVDAFFREKPAFRILVNTVAAMGATGYTTGLAPAMTLGPGSVGGSITGDNITPLHLMNVKRLAYEVRSMTRPTPSPAPGLHSAEDRPLTISPNLVAGWPVAPPVDVPGGRCPAPQAYLASGSSAPNREEDGAAASPGPPSAQLPGSAVGLTPDEVGRIVREFLAHYRAGSR
ncbi:MAG: aldehyde dehydrogenase family protein [Gemmatimonadetes bacterium]|nr:aldehyde dehydrogenase family protein [Gemmatimonadota bacterium]